MRFVPSFIEDEKSFFPLCAGNGNGNTATVTQTFQEEEDDGKDSETFGGVLDMRRPLSGKRRDLVTKET